MRTMEPRIIKGHRYLCKKSITRKGVGGKHEECYTQGRVYLCQQYSSYPGDEKFNCGFITDNQHMEFHGWPYNPAAHPWCHDRWTDYFTDIGSI